MSEEISNPTPAPEPVPQSDKAPEFPKGEVRSENGEVVPEESESKGNPNFNFLIGKSHPEQRVEFYTSQLSKMVVISLDKFLETQQSLGRSPAEMWYNVRDLLLHNGRNIVEQTDPEVFKVEHVFIDQAMTNVFMSLKAICERRDTTTSVRRKLGDLGGN